MEMLDQAIAELQALKKYRVDIERALEYGNNTHSFKDVCVGVVSGAFDVHILDGAIIIAELMKYPQARVYNVFIAAGSLEPILEAQREYLIREAQKRKASRLSFAGRVGWERVLKKEGWSVNLTVMSKEVPDVKIDHARERHEHQRTIRSGSGKLIQDSEGHCWNGIQPL